MFHLEKLKLIPADGRFRISDREAATNRLWTNTRVADLIREDATSAATSRPSPTMYQSEGRVDRHDTTT